jgi:hypothetical protein
MDALRRRPSDGAERACGRGAADKRGKRGRQKEDGRRGFWKDEGAGRKRGRPLFAFSSFPRHSNGVGREIQPHPLSVAATVATELRRKRRGGRRAKRRRATGIGLTSSEKAGGGEVAVTPGGMHLRDANDAGKGVFAPIDQQVRVAGIASEKGNTKQKAVQRVTDPGPGGWVRRQAIAMRDHAGHAMSVGA